MAETKDMVLPLLKQMRAEGSERHEQTDKRLSAIERRLDKIEQVQVSFRQALSADSLLSKLVTGDFQERISALETSGRKGGKPK